MDYDQTVIDAHEQKYKYSCIPSAVEIILKLLGKVDKYYYELQDDWDNKADGSFADFNGFQIEGVTFEHKFGSMRGSDFPYAELFNNIDDELASGRYVVVSLLTTSSKYHMYIIFDNKGDDYQAFTKIFSETTHFSGSIKNEIKKIQGTDILIYRI